MMNIIILMAGSNQTYSEAGYFYPKTLVEVNGAPMIEAVVNNINPLFDYAKEITFVIRRDDDKKFHIGKIVNLLVPKANVVIVEEQNAGAACSALLAIDHINEKEPLLILNGDQILDIDFNKMLKTFSKKDWDGGLVVFKAVHPRWSYVRCNQNGWVEEAAEKRPISDRATAGVCYFRHGKDFIESAMSSIEKEASIDGVFFIVPIYNEMVLKQKKIGVFQIDSKQYHSMMTPQLLENYENQL